MAGIHEIAKKAGTSEDIVKKVFAAVLEGACKGGSVIIRNFGTFKIKTRAARVCHNPQDPSKKINVPAKKVMAFKASDNLELE